MTYVVPLFYLIWAPEIRIKEHSVSFLHGNIARTIPAEEIASYDFVRLHGFEALRLEVKDRKPLICALPTHNLKIEVRRALAELRIERRATDF